MNASPEKTITARHEKVKMENKSARMPFFDNLKGILIILVVLGHFLSGATSEGILPAWHLFDFIYLFHMPLFVFASGLFCKRVYAPSRGLRVGVIMYYLLLCWMMYIALWLPQATFGVEEPFNLLTVNSSMPWYLMALAVYCALTPVFYELRPAFAIGCAVVASVLCGMVDVGNVLSASRVITFLPFFLIGYYLEPRAILDFVNGFGERLLVPRVFALIMILAMFLASQMLDIDELRASQMIFTGRDSYATVFPLAGDQGDISGCAIRLAGFACTAVIGVCLLLLVPQREVALLSRSGRHTLQVYIFHAFVSYAMAFLGVVPALYELMPSFAATAIVIALSVATTFVLGYPNSVQNGFNKLKQALDKQFSVEDAPQFSR